MSIARDLVSLLLGAALALGLLPPAGAPSAAQAPSSVFGVNGHVASRYGRYGRQQVPLDLLVQANVSWDREEFRWDVVQPAPGRWDWGFTDELVDKAGERGINILGLLAYSVGWATPSAGAGRNQPVFRPPDDLDAYRTYVRTVVERYRGRVAAWEVWNEPNHAVFWQPRPDGRRYGELLRVASEAIRAADPSARVVIGGISGSDVGFLQEVVASAGWGAFDVLAAHPYVAPRSPERGRLDSGELAKLVAFVDRNGGGKPIWLTEIGWPSANPGGWGVGDEGTQANYLVRGLVLAAASPGVERTFWYNWRNDGDDRSNDEQNYGLVNSDWRTPKAAFNAYRTLTQRLDGGGRPARLDLAGGARHTLLNFDGDLDWHIWGDGAWANVARSGEQARGGTAARVRFGFTNGAKAYVDLQRPVEAPGQPRRLGLWVHGDSSGHLLWATFRDANGEYFRLYLGAIGPGWQLRSAELAEFEVADGGDGVIQYPVRFQSLIVDNEPDGSTGEGSFHIDDLFVEEGPAVYGYRVARGDGHVDVLWSVGGGANLALPTTGSEAQVSDRDGQTSQVAAVDGALPLTLGEAPIFVEHAAPPGAGPALAAVPSG